MRQKHIVVVANDVGGVGGMEKHLEEMIQRMKQDFQVTVVASSFRVKQPEGVRFIRIPAPRKPFPLMIAMFSVLATIRLWFLKGDVIHTTGAIVWNRVNLSTIHFCHAGYEKAVGRAWVETSSGLRRLNTAFSMRLKLWSERFCYRPRQTRKLVAVSSRIRSELLAEYGYPQDRIEVIPNGVDIDRFRPTTMDEKRQLRRQKGLPEDGVYLLFMGGDWERKGLRWLMAAFQILSKDHLNLRVVVVGPGDVESYTRSVDPMHLDRVHFAGRQPDPETWYGLADVFVFPSQYEACSLAVLEAAASALAMVITGVGGADDVVEDGLSGCLVEPCASSIAQRVQWLLDQPERIRRLGAAARSRVESMTWDDTYRKFKAIYDDPAISHKESVGLVPGRLCEHEEATHHAV